MKAFCIAAGLLFSVFASHAQRIPVFPSGSEKFFDTVMSGINARHVQWVKNTAEKANTNNWTEEQVRTAATSWAVLGNISNADIEALCFLVLMQAAKSAQEDLKAIMAQVKAINDAKEKQRELLAEMQRLASKFANKKAGDPVWPPQSIQRQIVALDSLIKIAKMKIKANRNGPATKAQLDAMVDKMKSDLDSMSEMGEMESLRLQMAMDRLSKMMSTLSNILKKISDTAQSIVQNLK
jgi:hypothetical protein